MATFFWEIPRLRRERSLRLLLKLFLEILTEESEHSFLALQRRVTSDKIVEATGLILLLSAINPQVHFCEPGLEHKEDLFTASLACAKDGVTSFIEMPNTLTFNDNSNSPK
jgi:dihydroorotase-like cyclic amidohydrolase